jgi:peptidoglycan/LPS O-acetylase OafA/YrhL
MSNQLDGRLIPLEALRGMAAFIVLVHHFFLGFSPLTTGLLDVARDAHSLIGNPLFVFVNGTGAVSFFFTLSGFVLCWSLVRHPQPGKIAQAAIKRWPRLALLVLLSTLISCTLFKLDLYFFDQAAKVSASPWLAEFGYAGWTPAFEASYLSAAIQGITTFVTGVVTYNTNLWTMQPEFVGSMVVYGLAHWRVSRLQNGHQLLGMGLVAVFFLIFLKKLFPFVLGVMLCVQLLRVPAKSRLWVSGLCMLVGLYALGYMIAADWYAWVQYLPRFWQDRSQTLLHTFGSLLIIYATMTNEQIFQGLNGRLCQWLGRLSFPLYLVHGLVIYSISSYVFLLSSGSGLATHWVLAGTFLITVLVSVLSSLPLSVLDEWWVRQVNQTVKRWWP